jgi:hypothetical protein
MSDEFTPQTTETQQPDVSTSLPDSRAAALANALGKEVQQTSGAVSQAAGTESSDPWEDRLKTTQPKPSNIRERLIAKGERQRAAEQTGSLQSQFEQVKAQLEQVTSGQQKANLEFEALMKSGKVDEALKVRGLSVSFEDLQREVLKARGAISDAPRDPRVDAMAAELKALKDEKQKQQETIRQRQEQAAQQREWQEGLAQVKTEIESLELPGAKELTQLAGFPDAVLSLMMHNPEATIEQCTAVARRDYQAHYDQLRKAFEPASVSAPAQQSALTPAQSVAQRAKPRVAAPNPLQNLPDNVSIKERRQRALDMAVKGQA